MEIANPTGSAYTFVHNVFFWIKFTNHNSITQSKGSATVVILKKKPRQIISDGDETTISHINRWKVRLRAQVWTQRPARSRGKLCAFLSCMTSIPRPALLRTSAQVLRICPWLSWIDWLKLNPLRLNAMVLTPRAVNQIPTTQPRCEEEVQRARIVERSILENQTTEVSMCCNNVVGLFFLTELVTIVLRLCFSGFTYKTGSNETSVHSREKRSTEYPSNTEHMERVHKDVVFCLEYNI